MTVNINKAGDFSTKLLRNAKALNGRTTNYNYYCSTNGRLRMLPQVEAKLYYFC